MLAIDTADLAVWIDASAERHGVDLTDAQLMAAAEGELRRAGVEDARDGLVAAVEARLRPGETVAGVLAAERRRAVSLGLWDHGAAPWALLEV